MKTPEFNRRLIFSAIMALVCSATIASAVMTPEWLGRTYPTVISEDWMNIKFGPRKIGFSYNRIEEGDKGYRVTSRAVIRLDMMGVKQDLSFSRTFHLDKTKKPIGFVSIMKMGEQRRQNIGELKNNKLEMDITGIGGTSHISDELKPEVMFADILGFSMAEKFREGLKTVVSIYLVELRTSGSALIEVKGKKTIALDGKQAEVFVVDTTLQGFTSRAYVTKKGAVVREEQNTLGIVSERTTQKDALKFASGAVPVSSLITFSLIKPDKPLPNPAPLQQLRLMIGGVTNVESLPVDRRQKTGKPHWEKDKTGGRKLFVPVTTTKPHPKPGIPISSLSTSKPDQLKPTPEIQSDNPLIKNKAVEIIGGETDAWKAAVKINRWVYKNVEKKLVDSFSALDVLASRRGECQCHSNLFAAFSRSVGIPTRIASGIVYSPKNDGFFYHAWPEVYIGQWVAMDPTLGQDVADVTHVKLSQGGVESQLKLIQFIGRISIRVDSSEK